MLLLLKLWILSFVPCVAHAQTTSSLPSSTSSGPAATHSVNVGAAGRVFTPDSLTANIGDTVLFRFYPQNHSVARAEYKNPCIPYEVTGVGKQGFWSGFQPISVVLSDPPKFSVLINDTNPIFFYCSAPGACEEEGMIGVINPNSTQTLDVQRAFALNSTVFFSPGENFPAESKSATASPTSSTSTSTSSVNAAATATVTPTTSTAASSSSHPPLSTGAIAGIAIGGAAVLLIGAALVYLCGRQRTMGELLRRNHNPLPPPSYVSGPGHMSMASSAAYAKSPHVEVDPHRYSAQGGFYGGEDESYRSRSPPIDERGEFQNLAGNASPVRAGSPMVRRPVPVSPGRPNQLSPVSLVDGPTYEPLINGDGPQRSNSQLGPHELGVENDRNYLPYQSPRLR